MYPHLSNYQFPMFPASPTFYPPAFPAMPISPIFFNQSPQSCFNSPTLYPFSLASTPPTPFSSFNSASDFRNWSFPRSMSDSFSLPSVRSVSGSATSSSTGSATSSPEQQQQRQMAPENSSSEISVPSSSSGSGDSPKQENRRFRRGRMAKRSDGVKRRRMTSESEECDESEPRRIPLGTFNGRRVVLKLMGPRKPLE
ncbi:unnamed protein product [Caenorhabditis brenneri]